MMGRSLRSAIDGKCRDCGGQEGGARFWRLHVSACPVTQCPLWRVRPIASENPPAWLSDRDPAALPPGFLSLPVEQAIALIRAEGALFPTVSTGNSETVGDPELLGGTA
jgi:hypothetical protein